MIQSKLSGLAYFYAFLIVSFPIICVYLINTILNFLKGNWTFSYLAVVSVLGLLALAVFIWGFFVEMNLRMSKVVLYSEYIEIKQLLGFGTKRKLLFKNIDGFVVKKFKTRTQEQEYLYLIKNKRAIGVFSSLYYKNYYEIKSLLKNDLKEYLD